MFHLTINSKTYQQTICLITSNVFQYCFNVVFLLYSLLVITVSIIYLSVHLSFTLQYLSIFQKENVTVSFYLKRSINKYFLKIQDRVFCAFWWRIIRSSGRYCYSQEQEGSALGGKFKNKMAGIFKNGGDKKNVFDHLKLFLCLPLK